MLVTFHSLDSNDNKVFFRSNGIRIGNTLEFVDKTEKNTNIKITILEDEIVFQRIGEIEMLMEFKLGEKIAGYYKNKMGLEMQIITEATMILVKKAKIELEYILFLDSEPFSSHKIWILFE